jgi:hypothetical protein
MTDGTMASRGLLAKSAAAHHASSVARDPENAQVPLTYAA